MRREGLRTGYTTGACATAATRAALSALLGFGFPDPVTIVLPRGRLATFPLAERDAGSGWARAGVVKDAGDDPDVTHGCLVRVTVRRAAAGAGVVFRAGEGVGTVTLPGLPVPPGEPAINPVPRRMMREVVEELCARAGIPPDVEIEVAIPGGEELARRTWNPKLGIVGGLSVLGTTGIVVPYSCSAWIASIHRAVDVARALGRGRLVAVTGSTSETMVRACGIPEEEIVEVGDFVGGLVKYWRRHPLPRLVFAGGFAKTAKLAQGHLDLHSARSRLDPVRLARLAAAAGAPPALVEEIAGARTGLAALEAAGRAGFPLADAVAEAARRVLAARLPAGTRVEVWVSDRQGRRVGRAGEGRA